MQLAQFGECASDMNLRSYIISVGLKVFLSGFMKGILQLASGALAN